MAELVQIPAGARPAERGVSIQQRAGLPVRQASASGVGADIARRDDLARARTTVGDQHRTAGAALQQPCRPGIPEHRLQHHALAQVGDEALLGAEGRPAHGRVQAVRADDQVEAAGGALLEEDGDAVGVLGERGDGVVEIYSLRPAVTS